MSPDLPTSPGARSRAFSFRSDKSSESKGSKPRHGQSTENPRDKERRDSIWKETSKANPNAALGEAQPGERATFEQTTLESLRSHEHKDAHGNVIAEPDLSNPTRPRWERPLDTIKSFEKNIDNGYRRRSSMRTESYNGNSGSDQNHIGSNRNSYYGGNSGSSGYDSQGPSPGRFSQGGYYANRSPSGGYDNGYGPSSSQRQRYGSRMQSDGNMRYQGYSQHGYQNSHDTVNTGGSDSTGPWGNSTDPSSENSSLDRAQGVAMKYQQDGGYPQNSYGSPPIMEEQGSGSYGQYPQQNGYGAPPVQSPYGGGSAGRRPIPLGSSSGAPPAKLPPTARPQEEKKKSWIKRRFSKAD